VGKSSFDKFIPHYFTTWLRKSLDSYEFKATLLDFFKSDAAASKALESVDWDSWFYKPGLPPKPDFDTSMVDKCYALAKKWESEVSISWYHHRRRYTDNLTRRTSHRAQQTSKA
jgi:leukotriene-A4 hydrolase